MNLTKKIMLGTAIGAVAMMAGAQQPAKEHLKSFDKSSIDNAIAPGTDFYRYANTGWMKNHPLTPEYSRYGQFNILTDSSNNRIKRIVTSLKASNPKPGTVAYKVSSLYELAMDSTRRNAEGAAPIKPLLQKIESAKPGEMEELFFWMQKEYGAPLISVGMQENMVNSTEYAMYAGNGSMALGDRDYYLKDDKRSKEVREAYKKLIVNQMMNAGYSKRDAQRVMKNVMKIETAMADSALTKEESRDIQKLYNPRTLAQIKEAYPNFNWDKIFPATMGIAAPEQIIVTELRSLDQSNKLMASLTDREKKDLYLWQIVNGATNSLSDKFVDTAFEFEKVMSGVEQQQPRWKRALGATEGLLGEAIGELYVEKYFPASSKEYMIGLVENLRNALGKHIINLEWMSDDTKLQAIKKLNAITVKIGYPDKWKDYSTMEIDPSKSYYENRHNASMWHQAQQLAKWGKPVDKTEWGMTPQTVNAYYNPLANEIVFPAGILQAPFFDPNASDAENYGGIGVVIGHEMTHGFDDQGRNFDDKGNMTNWWQPQDAEAFAKLTKGLVEQFNAVEVLPGLHANGEFTLGENIADQGGLRVSYTAFLDSQRKKGVDINSESARIDGLTPEQVFYLNYANVWAQNIRPEEMRVRTMSDPHSLGENRVNVSLRNIQPFFEAFGITEGMPLYRAPKDRVIIW